MAVDTLVNGVCTAGHEGISMLLVISLQVTEADLLEAGRLIHAA